MKTLLYFLTVILSVISAEASNADWQSYQDRVLLYQTRIEGWCSPKKARSMMDLIYEVKPDLCVEVGVFGGSSIYPTASALKYLQKGQVYAIDPWETTCCLEGYDADNPNYIWWQQVDLNGIYLGFLNMLDMFQLNSHCVVIKSTGLAALDRFADESIDILHIDGNHTENSALSDAECYFSKVKKGGYIWLDDVNWLSVSRATEFLLATCEKIDSLSTGEYYLFKKRL